MQKNGFLSNKISCEIDLFDFTRVFGLEFLKKFCEKFIHNFSPILAASKAAAAEVVKAEPNYFNMYMKDALKYTAGMGSMNVLGMQSPNAAFTAMSTIFGLSCICGK